MKIIICLMALGFSTIVYGQPGRIKANPNKPPVKAVKPDTLGDEGALRPAAPATNGRTRQPRVNKTKLDDLKNPFDTSKVIQKQPNDFSRGTFNPQSGGQQQRTRNKPAGVWDKYNDSTYIKGRQSHKDFSWGASNPTGTGANKTARKRSAVQPREPDSLDLPRIKKPVKAASN